MGKQRTCIMDFPEAWLWTKASNLEDHEERCSWKTHKMLCDCKVLWDEYERRKAESMTSAAQKENGNG